MVTEGKAGFHNNEHTWQSGESKGKLEPETPAAQPPKCPECGSQRVWRDGLRYNLGNRDPIQRWLCRECGYRFSETDWNSSEGSERVQKVHRQILNLTAAYPSNAEYRVADGAMKNLAQVETRQSRPTREGTIKPKDLQRSRAKSLAS